MMLRSLALIRHSVLSRSVGLHTVSQTRQRCSGVNKGRSAGVNASKTRPLTEHINTAAAAALFGHVRTDETRGQVGLTPLSDPAQVALIQGAEGLTGRQTWWASRAAWSPGRSWRSTR